MKSDDGLRADVRRLLDEDRLEEAEALLSSVEALSDEDWMQWLEDAPVDEESLSPRERERLDEAAVRRRRDTVTKFRAG